MRVLYSLAIFCYGLGLRFAALFNGKAKQWRNGRTGIFNRLASAMQQIDRGKHPVVWFHASSLGEFEQGRPVIEAFRKRWPGKKILLTFFSPSGFEVRKNYGHADYIFYLPLDMPGNARKFLDAVRPEMAFFIKYDFWFNYIEALHERNIPLFVISALFREGQYFFRWYGGWSRRHLGYVARFFTQNRESAKLLESTGISRATVTGDTRFDRVAAIAEKQEAVPLVERFCEGKPMFIAGSTWEEDEKVLFPLIRQNGPGLKYVIAPHDPGPGRIKFIRENLGLPAVCYSELTDDGARTADVLIIDSVGMLSKLYRYATVAFVGGGFGNGIHNIQEPVTFGVPVMFGPRYQKFREAVDLVELGGAFCITSSGGLVLKTMEIAGNPQEHQRISRICRAYVAENKGATEMIMKHLEKLY